MSCDLIFIDVAAKKIKLADPGILFSSSEREVMRSDCPPPEVILGEIGCDKRTDIWDLGVLAYELATGYKLFA